MQGEFYRMETDGQSIFKADKDAAYFNRLGRGNLPEQMGIEILVLEANQVKGRVVITESHLAPNGILHAAVATSLADMCCGYGTIASLPEGAQGHATIELKCNYCL
jgi:acyl-coenzyme A thioesterase PaaI-like protein